MGGGRFSAKRFQISIHRPWLIWIDCTRNYRLVSLVVNCISLCNQIILWTEHDFTANGEVW